MDTVFIKSALMDVLYLVYPVTRPDSSLVTKLSLNLLPGWLTNANEAHFSEFVKEP